jgi:hypothetical protein
MVSSFTLDMPDQEEVAIQLRTALRERLAIVADESSRRDARKHIERLREVSERISDLEANLPKPVDSRLKHYLDRCSYSKALEFLEGAAPSSLKNQGRDSARPSS